MANDLNDCKFIGRLAKDPESRAFGENSVCNFTVAVGKSWTDKNGAKQERTEWVRVSAWGKLGQICQQYLTKGKQVFIAGEMKTDEYTDQSGAKKYSTAIDLRDMQMLGSKSDNAGSGQAPQQSAAPAQQQGSTDFDPDLIPF